MGVRMGQLVGDRGGEALGPRPRAGRSSHPTPHSVLPVMEEGLPGSQQSCLLVSPFPSGPSAPPTGPASCARAPSPAPAAGGLPWTRGPGVGRVGIHAQLPLPLRTGC